MLDAASFGEVGEGGGLERRNVSETRVRTQVPFRVGSFISLQAGTVRQNQF